ncbi:MAG: glycoside hydrolase family 55 protein [Kiritimatiellae bacterium]|nr:glycoside hydrolase family 55 protein [Kiritimatiellia bacterium]
MLGFAVALWVALADSPRSEEIVFPPGARVANVRDYGAKGDGVTDDTEAFQRALREEPENHLIYVPNGRYIISQMLVWGRGKKRQVLQGQSEEGTILQLADNCPGFRDPNNPQSMIWTGKAPAQRFRNGLRNLTLDTGRGNPGAIGVRFIANNQGGMHRVTIRSGDPEGRGVIGLDLGYTNEQGPCLIEHVTIRGFDVGIFTQHPVDSVTFEHIRLEGQRVAGIRNAGQIISFRRLTSRNAVPAIVNLSGPGLVTLIESELVGLPGTRGAALINEQFAAMFLRDVRAPGYERLLDNASGHGRGVAKDSVEEFVTHEPLSLFPSPARSLRLPAEETPDVPWDPADRWVSVTDFGPPEKVTFRRVGDGKKFERENWAPALQRAIDSGATTIYFPHKPGLADYAVHGTIRLRGNLRRLIGCEANLGAVVAHNNQRTMFQEETSVPLFIMEDGAAPVVVIERFNSWYTAPRFEQRSARRLVIRHMSFYEVETYPGAGDTFLHDVRAKSIKVAAGTRVFGRQVNPEGWEEPRLDVDGGTLWILGLKTENDPTIGRVRNGGSLEILGGLIYANKADISPKQMFIVESGGRLSATVGEWVTRRNAPFDILVERRNGEERRMLKGQAYGRGQGAMVPLLVAYPPRSGEAAPLTTPWGSAVGGGADGKREP